MMMRFQATGLPQSIRDRVAHALAGSALLAAVVLTAPLAQAQGHGPMHGGAPMGMASGMMFGGSPEQVARRVDRMLDGLNASDAQRSQIKQIAEAAAVDLRAQRETVRSLRERGLQIFTAPSVDAAAAESVRQQLEVQHDDASRRMLQAMLDVSRVLTPEQRAAIATRMQQHQAHGQQQRMQRMPRDGARQ